MVTYNVVVEIPGIIPYTPRRGAHSQVASRAYGAGIKYALKHISNEPVFYVFLATCVNGKEIDRQQI